MTNGARTSSFPPISRGPRASSSPAHGAPGDPAAPAADLAVLLAEQREALRAFEGTALAQIAAVLSGAADSLAASAERLERLGGKDVLTFDEAAVRLGFVDDETGEIEREAFRRAAAEAGLTRHKLSTRRIYYLWDELKEELRDLPG